MCLKGPRFGCDVVETEKAAFLGNLAAGGGVEVETCNAACFDDGWNNLPDQDYFKTTSTTMQPTTTAAPFTYSPTFRCTTPVDLIFALDESASLDSAHWQQSKTFVAQLLTSFTIGNGATDSRVQFVTYSDNPVSKFGSSADLKWSTKDAVNAVLGLEKKTENATFATPQMSAMLEWTNKILLVEENGFRPNVPSIMIVLSGMDPLGPEYSNGKLTAAVEKVADKDVAIFAVGICSSWYKSCQAEHTKAVATSPETFFKVDAQSLLLRYVNGIGTKVCAAASPTNPSKCFVNDVASYYSSTYTSRLKTIFDASACQLACQKDPKGLCKFWTYHQHSNKCRLIARKEPASCQKTASCGSKSYTSGPVWCPGSEPRDEDEDSCAAGGKRGRRSDWLLNRGCYDVDTVIVTTHVTKFQVYKPVVDAQTCQKLCAGYAGNKCSHFVFIEPVGHCSLVENPKGGFRKFLSPGIVSGPAKVQGRQRWQR